MKTTVATVLVLILAFLGLADAWYLGDAALSGSDVSCNIAILNGCNKVAASPYSHFLGIPVGVLGAIFYAAVFMLAAISLVLPQRRIHLTLFWLTIAGAFVSVILTTIQITLIHVGCIYCIISGITSFLLFFTSFFLVHHTRPRGPRPVPLSSRQ